MACTIKDTTFLGTDLEEMVPKAQGSRGGGRDRGHALPGNIFFLESFIKI